MSIFVNYYQSTGFIMVLLHPLNNQIAEPPQKFTYPFCYEPHPLCVEASKKVRRYVSTHEVLREDAQNGKMFGVLVVEKKTGK